LGAPSGSPKKKGNKAKGELVSKISTVEIKKTKKISTSPLKKKSNSQDPKATIPESEEPLLKEIKTTTQQQSSQDQVQNKKMEQNKQPQIHPTPQPQMSQMAPMTQPSQNCSYQSQVVLQNQSQSQLYNGQGQGQYSITVNTNDPNAFTTMMMPSIVSRNPVQMRCPYCNENIVTVIKYENNSLVWILTILLFIFCCCCFCIPLLIDDIKDVIHYCPICNREIARIDR